MRKTFTSCGYDYVFEVIRGNEIVFYLENGSGHGSEKDLLADEFGYKLSATRTVNSIRNPFEVFSRVRDLVLAYVLGNNVPYFSFQGGSDRLAIY